MPTLASLPAELLFHIISFIPSHLQRPAHHALTLQSRHFLFLLGSLPRPRLTEPEDRILRPSYRVDFPICFRCLRPQERHDIIRFSLWRELYPQGPKVISYRIYCLPCARHMCASPTFRTAVVPGYTYWVERTIARWCPGCERFEVLVWREIGRALKRKFLLPLRSNVCKLARDEVAVSMLERLHMQWVDLGAVKTERTGHLGWKVALGLT